MYLKLENIKNYNKIYFTSDTHYNHKNICRGVSNWKDKDGNVPVKLTRNFKTLEDMNYYIVDMINSTVEPDSILFHLGDWSFGGFDSIKEFRQHIKCKNIHLILGNHDHHIENNKENIQRLFTSVNQYLRLRINNHNFILMHYPIASWHNMNTGVIHLHGHVHLPKEQKIASGKAMDVGLDGNDLQLYTMEEILSIMKDRPISKLSLPIDHHDERLVNSEIGSSKF